MSRQVAAVPLAAGAVQEADMRDRLLPVEAAERDAGIAWLERRYAQADAASVEAARHHRRVLAGLAVAGTALTLAFLLYDEAEALWMIWLVGALIACQWVVTRMARASGWHERYVEQRVLAECLRVQAYLRYAGLPTRVGELVTWSQRHDLPWIMAELDAPELASAPTEAHDVSDVWIGRQRAYHERAVVSSRARVRHAEAVQNASLVASVVLYLATLVFEVLCGGLVWEPVVVVGDVGLWRAGFKIALGTFSAAALFISSYYGKLALDRTLADHERMVDLFDAASEGMSLEQLAREQLVENATWYSYQKESAPEISL